MNLTITRFIYVYLHVFTIIMVEFTIHALSNHPVISTTHFLDVLNLCSFEGWRPSPGLAVISFCGYGCNINPVDLRLAKTV